MRSRLIAALLVPAASIVAGVGTLGAFPDFARETKAPCASCHASPAGGAELTDVGKAFKADHKKRPPPAPAVAEFVGGDRCLTCHPAQHQGWQATKHANAFATLEHADPEMASVFESALKIDAKGHYADNDACVICHVTGFHLPGGYPAADSARTAALRNVTCESCHGPGSRHITARLAEKKKLINRNVSAKLCLRCHTPAVNPEFKAEEAMKHGVHAAPDSTATPSSGQ